MAGARADGTRKERTRAKEVLERLRRRYPEIGTALDYTDPWQLLVSTILSAQTTDEMVNKVTPILFERYPTPEALAGADLADVERILFSTGFYRQKSRAVVEMSADLVERYGGEVPRDLGELTTLRGVGRKTASVVLAEAWKMPAIAVDTHVRRVSRRIGMTAESDPSKIEKDLKALLPMEDWAGVSMRLIQFGRDVCIARAPRCFECELVDVCDYPDKRL